MPDPAEVRVLDPAGGMPGPRITALALVGTTMPVSVRAERRVAEDTVARAPAGRYTVTASCSDGVERSAGCTLSVGVSEVRIEGDDLRIVPGEVRR